MDRWILSKLNTLIASVSSKLDEYNITDSAREIQDFVDELSNWYVRRGRERYWGEGIGEDKAAAYATLYHVLVTLSKVIAPYVPFLAETIYQNLVCSVDANAPESVHLCTFPEADASKIDELLERGMADVLDVVVLGRAARSSANIKNRQPLSTLYVSSERDIKLTPELLEIVADELNVKEYKTADDAKAFISYELKPQLKTLGPKYGKLLGGIRKFFAECDAAEVVETVSRGELYNTEIDGTPVSFAKDDLLINIVNRSGFEAASDKGITVILDTTLSEELIAEGFVREIVSKIQTMRKEAGFEVTDRIIVSYAASEKAGAIIAENATAIAGDVLAVGVEQAEPNGYVKDWDINGDKVTLGVRKQN